MADNADLTTSKRKQPDQDSTDSVDLKRSKTTPIDEVADKSEADDKSDRANDDNALDSDKEQEQEQEDDEEDNEEEDDNDDKRDDSGDEKAPKHHSNKAESSSKSTGLSDNDDDGISDGELEALDTSLIMNTGRRTRGKKIDYTQFGADTPADEE